MSQATADAMDGAALESRLWPLFAAAWVAIALLWLPLALIPTLDGLLFVASTGEVLRDLGMLWALALVPAAVLAVLGLAASTAARAAGCRPSRAGLVGWCVVLLPLLWACTWHAARMVWQWLRALMGSDLLVSQEMRIVAVFVLAAGLTWALRRWTLIGVIRQLASGLLAARWLAFGVLLLAALAIAANPPTWLGWPDTPRTNAAATKAQGPDIIFISLDAVAAADADACNPASTTMPRLARLAAQSSCFTRFYTASNFTTPTTSTMESGLLPWRHFATQPDAKMLDATRDHTLAAVLRGQGWQTHSVTDNLLASPRHRGSFAGYTSAGFAHTTLSGNWFREAMTVFPDTALPRLLSTAVSFIGAFDVALHGEHSPYESDRTYTQVLSLLAGESAGAGRFIWAHTLPPHSPYLPPASTKYKLLARGELETWRDMMPDNVFYAPTAQALVNKHRLRYRESLMAADAALGLFLDELLRQGRLDGALVIISSDHGESFENGFLGHAGPLTHDALIRVPLVVKLPGQKLARTITMPVSQADLAPTILDLVGAPALPVAEGRSLRSALEGQAMASVPVFAMTMERQSRFKPLDRGRFVVIDGDDKLTLPLDPTAATPPAATLHNLGLDLAEQHNLAAGSAPRVAALKAVLLQRLASAAQTQASVQAGRAATTR